MMVQFLWNFLGEYWKPAGDYAALSVLHFYKPVAILVDAAVPVSDMGILFGVGALLWTAAGFTLARRDICTV